MSCSFVVTSCDFDSSKMSTTIKFFKKSKALRAIWKLNITDIIINQWYVDQQPSCYILYEDDKPVTFALMSKMDFDPLNKHSRPKTLNYIYTMDEHRGKGYGAILVNHIKDHEQFSAFCSNEASENLFKKCNCINYGEMCFNTMYRYP